MTKVLNFRAKTSRSNIAAAFYYKSKNHKLLKLSEKIYIFVGANVPQYSIKNESYVYLIIYTS
jgi:hypothetical protein